VQLVRFPDFVKTVCESGKYQPNNDNPIPRDLTLILAAEEWFEWGKLFLFDPDKTVRYLLRLSDILKTRHAPTRRHLITMPAVVSSSGEILRPETRTVHQFQVAKRFPHHGYNFYMNHSPARIILAELFREDPQRTIRELEEISRIPDRAKLIPKHILEELRKRRETTK